MYLSSIFKHCFLLIGYRRESLQRKADDSSRWRRTIVVAVGTTIADRPPHRSVQARLRIRLLSWMSGGEAGVRVRMQNAGLRNPPVQRRDETIPSHLGALTATD